MWVSKKAKNAKIAMILANGLVALSFLVLGFSNSNTPIMIYFITLALTGVAESFRAVSITPTAQSTLDPSELGIGTSLLTFVNSLSPLFAAAIDGIMFDVNKNNIQTGINGVFFITAAISLIGALIAIFKVKIENNK